MRRDKLVVEAMQLLGQLNETENQVSHMHAQAIGMKEKERDWCFGYFVEHVSFNYSFLIFFVGKYQDNQQLWTNLETTKQNIEQQAEKEAPAQTQSYTTQSQGRHAASSASVASSQNTNEKAKEK